MRDGGYARPVSVRVGISDGTSTEVAGRSVKEGTEAVIGENTDDDGGDDTTNPFAPKIFKGGGAPGPRP